MCVRKDPRGTISGERWGSALRPCEALECAAQDRDALTSLSSPKIFGAVRALIQETSETAVPGRGVTKRSMLILRLDFDVAPYYLRCKVGLAQH